MTSGYSRPLKYVREVTGVASLEEAEILRQQPFWVVVHQSASARAQNLVRALVAIAVRSCSGEINVRILGTGEFRDGIESIAETEALGYGCIERLSIADYSENEKIGAGITIGMQLPNMIAVDASGMYAAVNHVLVPSAPPPHSAAACFAAATAFAKYFASTVLDKHVSKNESWGFSLDTMSVSAPTELVLHKPVKESTLGKVHLLGAGAIGSAFCFSVHLSNDAAEIDILDREKYDEPNQETTFFLTKAEAVRCPPKAAQLAKNSSREGLPVVGRPKRELQAGDSFLEEQCDAFVCAVDNAETRRILDSAKCNVLLNGGLGGSKSDAGHVLVSWHNAGVRGLAELYPDDISPDNGNSSSLPSEIKDDCSRLEYESVSLAAPFVALSSGALLHAFCKLSAEGRLPDANYFKLDLLRLQSKMSRKLLC